MAQRPDDESKGRPSGILTRSGTVPVTDSKQAPEEKKHEEDTKDEKKQESYISGETDTRDWLRVNGHPLDVLPYLQSRNVNVISDIGRLDDNAFRDLMNNVPIDANAARQRFVADMNNYRRLFTASRPERPPLTVPEGKVDDISNFELGYLGLYKCVIWDYIWHKRIPEEPSCNTVAENPDGTLWSAAVAVSIPDPLGRGNSCIITGKGIAADQIVAEFAAYRNMFAKMLRNPYVDQVSFHGLTRKYRTYKYIYQRSRRQDDEIWLYFWGFRRHRSSSEEEKARYFFNKNTEDCLGGKKNWLPMRIDKQGVWFDGFYYLFREQIEANQEIYEMIVLKHTELVFLWMRSYCSRTEFFGRIIERGLLNALLALSTRV